MTEISGRIAGNHTVEPSSLPAKTFDPGCRNSKTGPPEKAHCIVRARNFVETESYKPPTVESVADTDDEHASHSQMHGDKEADNVSSDGSLNLVDTDVLRVSSPACSSRDDKLIAQDNEQSAELSDSSQGVQHQPQPPPRQIDTCEERKAETGQLKQSADLISSPALLAKRHCLPLATQKLRRSVSDYGNFERYAKHFEMAKEKQISFLSQSGQTACKICDPCSSLEQKSHVLVDSSKQPFVDDGCGNNQKSSPPAQCEQKYEPCTFGVHTVSPSIAPEQLCNDQQNFYASFDPVPPVQNRSQPISGGYSNSGRADWQPHSRTAQSRDSLYSTRGRSALSDCDEDIEECRYFRVQRTPSQHYDEPFDPIGHLGEGIPPYNFDLFSEASSTYAADNDSNTEQSATRNDFFTDADINKLFYGTARFNDTYECGEEKAPPSHHRFEDEPIIPDFDFGLFTDARVLGKPSCAAGRVGDWTEIGGRTSINHQLDRSSQPSWHSFTPTFRGRPQVRGEHNYHSPPTDSAPSRTVWHVTKFEVEEYDGSDDDTNSSCTGELLPGLVSTTQRIIDCEVISDPEDTDCREQRTRSDNIKCR